MSREQNQTHADQKFNINVISMRFAEKLNLKLLSLSLIRFCREIMHIANYKNISLQFWI